MIKNLKQFQNVKKNYKKVTCVIGNIFKRLIMFISPISRDLKVFYTIKITQK